MNSLALREGASHSRPPLFDDNEYSYWKDRMRAHLRSMGVNVWRCVEYGYEDPMIEDDTTKLSRPKKDNEWSVIDRENYDANSRAINALYCAISVPEFHRVSSYTTAKEVWDAL